jgi:hypothetical protein
MFLYRLDQIAVTPVGPEPMKAIAKVSFSIVYGPTTV